MRVAASYLAALAALGLVLAAFVAVAAPAAQASARIAPVQIDISPEGRGTLRITNLRSREVLYQLTPYHWDIVDNRDVHEPTNDFIASPPSFSLRPDETREIRVGFRNARRSHAERAYRLVVEEVPIKADRHGGATVDLVMRYRIPVFVAPEGRPEPDLVWAARREGETFIVRVENRGNRRAVVGPLGVNAKGRDGAEPTHGISGRHYVLAGTAREWSFRVPADASPGALLVRTGRDRNFTAVPLTR